MRSSIEYLDEAKAKIGIESDYAFAKNIGITRGAMSNYRNKVSIMDDYTAAQVANILGIQAIIVIAAANAERERDDGKKDFWQKYWKKLGGIAASIFLMTVTLFVTVTYPTPAQAAPMLDTHSAFSDDIHYAK